MTKADELRRIASQITNEDLTGKTLAPILKAMADAMVEGGIAGVWGNGQVDIDSIAVPSGNIEASNVQSFMQGIGQVFAYRFTITATVSNATAETNTVHFEADVHREVPEDFWAMGVGYIHTTDGSGGYTPVIVEIGPSAEGGSIMDVHMLPDSAITNGTFLFSGYVTGLWNGAGYSWPNGQ